MNLNSDIKKVNIDASTLTVLYKHYKEFLLPVGIIIISILLFFFFVIPGIQNYFAQQDLAKAEEQKLQVLKNNLNTLSSLNDSQLNQNLGVLSAALPSGKDFAGVINAINTDAALTGVSVGDFEFQVGDLSQNPTGGGGAFPTLQLNVSLNGDPVAILKYLSELSRTVPISEVTSIKTSGNFANLTLLFYFKPFISSNLSDETPVNSLSSQDLSLVSNLSKWNTPAAAAGLNISVPASSSALTIPSSGSNSSPF